MKQLFGEIPAQLAHRLHDLEKGKDLAYWERNQLVAALSRLFPSSLAKHPESDTEWEKDWRTIVVIYVPQTGGRDSVQCTWHIHDFDVPMFDHLKYDETFEWDGHSTEQKYRRLRDMEVSP